MADLYYSAYYDDSWLLEEWDVGGSGASSNGTISGVSSAIIGLDKDASGNYYGVTRDSDEVIKWDSNWNEQWRTTVGNAARFEGYLTSGGVSVGNGHVVVCGLYSSQLEYAVLDVDTGSATTGSDGALTVFSEPVHANHTNDRWYIGYIDSASGAISVAEFDYSGSRLNLYISNTDLGNDASDDFLLESTHRPGGGVVVSNVYTENGPFDAERGEAAVAWDDTQSVVGSYTYTTTDTAINENHGIVSDGSNIYWWTELSGTKLDNTLTELDKDVNFDNYPRGEHELTPDNWYAAGQTDVWQKKKDLTQGYVDTITDANYHVGATFPDYGDYPSAWSTVEQISATQTAVTGTMNTVSETFTTPIGATQVAATANTNGAIVDVFRLDAAQPSAPATMNTTALVTIEPVSATQVASLATTQSGAVSMSQPATSVSTTATPSVGSVSQYTLSAQSVSSAASINSVDTLDITILESTQPTVSASQNSGSVTSLTTGATQFTADGSLSTPLLTEEISTLVVGVPATMNGAEVARVRHILRGLDDETVAEINPTANKVE